MKDELDVLITVPVYNEEKQLREKILELYKYTKKNLTKYSYKIVVAENGSKDRTQIIARELEAELPDVELFVNLVQGRGKTLYNLWEQENAKCYVYMDLDLATDKIHILELIDSILVKNCDLSYGSRNLEHSDVHRGLKRTIFSKGYILLLKLFFQINSTDTQCGFKALSKSTVERLWPLMDTDNWEGAAWFFDAELIILADKLGLKIFEIPVKWTEAPGTTVSLFHTVKEDLNGMLRMLRTKPWKNEQKNKV